MEKPRTGILLVNLGTPASPAVADVRTYLKEFLLDPRVIDIPHVPRNLLVRGLIAPFRAPKSAKTYKAIWTENGSPLMYHSEQMACLLQEQLGDSFVVKLAMRYQQPSLAKVLAEMEQLSLAKIRIIPLFPQYASATTGSVHDRVMEIIRHWQTIPDLEFINSYADHPGLVETFVARASVYDLKNFDHILFSFHGLPVRQLIKADFYNHCQQHAGCCETISTTNFRCYGAQCHQTAQLIAAKLGLSREQYTVCFQSRLGKTPWIQPYSSETIEKLARTGVKRLLVFSPAFVADCLETIFEIGVEYREDFEKMGGEKLQLVESLNNHPRWIATLADLSTKVIA